MNALLLKENVRFRVADVTSDAYQLNSQSGKQSQGFVALPRATSVWFNPGKAPLYLGWFSITQVIWFISHPGYVPLLSMWNGTQPHSLKTISLRHSAIQLMYEYDRMTFNFFSSAIRHCRTPIDRARTSSVLYVFSGVTLNNARFLRLNVFVSALSSTKSYASWTNTRNPKVLKNVVW